MAAEAVTVVVHIDPSLLLVRVQLWYSLVFAAYPRKLVVVVALQDSGRFLHTPEASPWFHTQQLRISASV